jgi:hypothetical protein
LLSIIDLALNMSMKIVGRFLLVLFIFTGSSLFSCFLFAEEPPVFVKFLEKENNTHTALIEGMLILPLRGAELDVVELERIFMSTVPQVLSLKFNLEKNTCTITTARKLKISELKNLVNGWAAYSGLSYYWAELQAKEFKRSESLRPDTYQVKQRDIAAPEKFAWFNLTNSDPFTSPFAVYQDLMGTLVITPRTAQCMAHSVYTIRVLDPTGEVIWEDTTTLFGSVGVAITDADGDGVHELLINRDDHGRDAKLQISRNPLPEPKVTGEE